MYKGSFSWYGNSFVQFITDPVHLLILKSCFLLNPSVVFAVSIFSVRFFNNSRLCVAAANVSSVSSCTSYTSFYFSSFLLILICPHLELRPARFPYFGIDISAGWSFRDNKIRSDAYLLMYTPLVVFISKLVLTVNSLYFVVSFSSLLFLY